MLIQLSILEYVLYGALAFMLLIQLYFFLRYLAGVLYVRRQNVQPADNEPGVTVVVCARNEAEHLEYFLQSLLTQDYPTYEVIVVDDGSEDASRVVIENYQHQDSRLRMTFVPRGARMKSTKKLALTLAAKAAKYNILLLTDADCRPESNQWIRAMVQGFNDPKTEIVLGYGAYFREPGFLNRVIRFDTLFNGLHYLGAAISHAPYMGVGRNLAYRRDTFFTTGGFSRLMTERAGDDDLFVNRVANRINTTVVVSPESITWSLTKKTWKDWLQQKRRHLSVSPRYKFSSKFRLGLEPLSRGCFYGLLIAIAVLLGPLGWMVAAGAYVLRLALQWLILNLAARRLHQSRVGLELIVCDIMLPLISLYMLLTQPLFKKNMRW